MSVWTLAGAKMLDLDASPSWQLRDVLALLPPLASTKCHRRILLGSVELHDGHCLADIGAASGDALTLVEHRLSEYLLGCSGNDAKIWSIDSDQPLRTLQGHTSQVRSATFSPDCQQVITASSDSTAKVWSTPSGVCLRTLQGHAAEVWFAKFSRGGRRAITASLDDTARVWCADSWQCLRTLECQQWRRIVALSPSGQQVITPIAGVLSICSVDSGNWFTLGGWTGEFSPDSQRVITACSDLTAKIQSVTDGRCLHTLRGHADALCSAAFSPDGARAITISRDCTAKLWSATNGRLLHTLEGHRSVVTSAAFSPDGQKVITLSHDGAAKIWSTTSAQCMIALPGWLGLNHASFSPDGLEVLTTSNDEAKIWSAESMECQLTLEECKYPSFAPLLL